MILLIGERPSREGGARALPVFFMARALDDVDDYFKSPTKWMQKLAKTHRPFAKLLVEVEHVNLMPLAFRPMSEEKKRGQVRHLRSQAACIVKDMQQADNYAFSHLGMRQAQIRPVFVDEVWLCGRRVLSSFNSRFRGYFQVWDSPLLGRKTVMLPSPSLQNGWWSEAANRQQVLEWLEAKSKERFGG